jgi:hypothetical protein
MQRLSKHHLTVKDCPVQNLCLQQNSAPLVHPNDSQPCGLLKFSQNFGILVQLVESRQDRFTI